MSTLSVSLTFLVQLKHIPPLSLFLSIPDFPAASSCSLLLYFLSFPVYQALILFLVFMLKQSFPCSACYYKWHPLHMPLNFLFGVSGHCKNSWRLETCLSLSLLSSSCLYGSTCTRSFTKNTWCNIYLVSIKCFSLFLIYILGSALLHGLLTGSAVPSLPSVPNSWDRQLSQNNSKKLQLLTA